MKKLLFYASAVAVLFSSCSKDATEDIAIQTGNKVFTASINVEDDAQTRLSLNGTQYVWEVNDAIGVNSEKATDANILVSTSVCGSNPAFSVSNEDLERWLGTVDPNTANDHNHLFVYFPYKSGAKVVDGKIDVTIPAVQRYAENSFYRNTVSALGFVEEYAGSEQDIELKVPTALLQIQVAGFGEAESISMKIFEKGETDAVKLAGTAKVAVAPAYDSAKEEYKAYAPVVTPADLTVDAADYVTVDFGKLPEELKYNGTLKINFIVPAGINLSEATLEFMLDYDPNSAWERGAFHKMGKANALNENNTFVTKANARTNIGTKETGFTTIKFNLENKFLVENEEAFLAYAYLSRPGVATEADNADDKFIADYAYAAEMMGIEIESVADYAKVAAVEALVIVDELDFADFGKTWADARIAAIEAEDYDNAANNFWHRALNWYKGNGYAIQSLSYNGVYGNSMTTIKNLNVLGSGLTNGASLKNLTLENVTVNAGIATTKTTTTGTTTTTTTTYSNTVNAVGLIAANNEIASTAWHGSEKWMDIENVVIGEGNKVNAKVAGKNVTYVGGIYAKLNNTSKNVIASKNIKGITLDIHAERGYTPVVGRLYAHTGLFTTIKLDLTNCAWDATQASYPVIGEANSSIEAKGGVSTTMINAGVVGNVNVSDVVPGAYVYVDGVSYWNGGKVLDNGIAPFTAEELAYYMETLDLQGTKTATLTNDINMQCSKNQTVESVWVVGNNLNLKTSVKTPGTNPVYNTFEIKNLIVDSNYAVATLFGYESNIENVNLTNVTLNASSAATIVSGVAETGKATNVTIDGLTINIDKGVAAKSIKSIGGVFAEADVNDIDNVNVKTLSLIYGGTKNFGARAGIIAGTLNIEPNSEAKLKAFNCGAKNHTFTNIASEQKDGADSNGNFYTVYAQSNNYGAALPFGTISVNNAAANGNGNTKAYLKLTEANFGSMTRLAAGVVFSINQADLKAKTAVGHDATAIDSYKYVFISDGKIAQQNTIFGFTAKKQN